jgi:hypothetical protein
LHFILITSLNIRMQKFCCSTLYLYLRSPLERSGNHTFLHVCRELSQPFQVHVWIALKIVYRCFLTGSWEFLFEKEIRGNFDNKFLRRISRCKRTEIKRFFFKVHNVQNRDLYSLYKIMTLIKLRASEYWPTNITHESYEKQKMGNKRSSYRNSPRAEKSGDRIPVGGDNFRTRPDRPWLHPASCTMGTGSLP